LALLSAAPGPGAAQEPAPTIILSSQDPNSLPGYTDMTDVNVAWTIEPVLPYCPGGGCHFEYCLTQKKDLSNCTWQHQIPTSHSLGKDAANGQYTVYAEYQIVSSGTVEASLPGSATIILNLTKPSVNLNSPAGLVLDANTGATQVQFLSAAAAQWVTYSASSSAGESVTVAVDACPRSGTCTQLTPAPLATPPYMWEWPTPPATEGYAYMQLTATDEAGNRTPLSIRSIR
jgi:hypothetical protein